MLSRTFSLFPFPVRKFTTQNPFGAAVVPLSIFEKENVVSNYYHMWKRLERAKKSGARKLTLTEKILFSHLDESQLDEAKSLKRGESYLQIHPDRVALQDASAQMTLLQFIVANQPRVSRPTTLHCDHLVVAENNATDDLKKSAKDNEEVFQFLESVCKKFGIGFWKPGAGIIHQIVLENYALPGGLLIGTDSHSPNSGGMSMMGIGVGGGDAVDAMLGQPYELRMPRVIGVELKGQMSGWCSPKDLILHLAGKLTVDGGTGYVLEYYGEGVQSLTATGMSTICNMGAELGATSSIFPFSGKYQSDYLRAQGRSELALFLESNTKSNYLDFLQADSNCIYDKTITIDLSKLEPHINGPFTPDRSTPISEFAEAVISNKWPSKISRALIGSCTNSSYQDMTRSQSIVDQITNVKTYEVVETGKEKLFSESQVSLTVSPGSTQIRETMDKDKISESFSKLGATVFSNACGPCIGQWNRTDTENLKNSNSILTSFNRNFAARNDGNRMTHTFLASPEIVCAMSLVGDLTFNPLRDIVIRKNGTKFKFSPPTGDILPPSGFSRDWISSGKQYISPENDLKVAAAMPIHLSPTSPRLQLLTPFIRDYDNFEISKIPILIKVKGKCTTDHINPAGKWLKYRGHLDTSSDNTLIGAMNADNGKINSAFNKIVGDYDTIPGVARAYKAKNLNWVIIGDENYGEGSARELAAMQPRYLNGVAVICKSIARIHEANLKKHGLLALVFKNPSDYDKISGKDFVSMPFLKKELDEKFALENHSVTLEVQKEDGTVFTCLLKHSFNEAQLKFFKAGSALSYWNSKAKDLPL